MWDLHHEHAVRGNTEKTENGKSRHSRKELKTQMDLLQTLKNLFIYAGAEKKEYNSLSVNIRKENLVLLSLFSRLAGIMFFLLFIGSMLSNGFTTVNSSTYLTCGFIMLAIMLCVRFIVPKYPPLVTVLVYVFEIVLYVFSIRISMLHAEKQAVSAIAFLLVSPLLFYDRPVRLTALIVMDVTAFCVIVLRVKQPEIAETDVWNMVTFGFVAVVTTLFIMSIKIRALAQTKQIEYMSQTDLLTGLKNRNHFENQLMKYPEMCKWNLICVYGDVNGLHEVNNRQGHPAGDRMLREVATVMQAYFGQEHTYRIGGDEFAAFRMDTPPEDVSAEIERMRQELTGKGYYVSFGLAVHEKGQDSFDMHKLVKKAEDAMFSAKREFYRLPEHNRRHR